MAIKDYSVGAVVINDTADILIGGITQMDVEMGTTVTGEPTSGSASPRFSSVTAIKPSASFQSRAIDEILNNFDPTGFDISALATGLELYLNQHKPGGTRDLTAAIKYLIAEGIVGLKTLSCDHQGDAIIGASILPTWDGSNDPIVKTEGAGFPAVAGENRYTIGPCTVGGKLLTGVQSVEFEFGQNMLSVGSDSDIYDRRASIRDYTPTITLRGNDPDWWKSDFIPSTGLACTHANSIIYLRHRLLGSTYVADGTATHISFTFDGTAVIQTATEGSGNDPAETSITITLRETSPAPPVVINPLVIDTTTTIV